MYGSNSHFKETMGHAFDHSINTHAQMDAAHSEAMLNCPQDYNYQIQVRRKRVAYLETKYLFLRDGFLELVLAVGLRIKVRAFLCRLHNGFLFLPASISSRRKVNPFFSKHFSLSGWVVNLPS